MVNFCIFEILDENFLYLKIFIYKFLKIIKFEYSSNSESRNDFCIPKLDKTIHFMLSHQMLHHQRAK